MYYKIELIFEKKKNIYIYIVLYHTHARTRTHTYNAKFIVSCYARIPSAISGKKQFY